MSKKQKLLESVQKNLAKGQTKKALKDLEKVVKIDSSDFRSRQKLADLYSRAKMPAEAYAEYSTVADYYAEHGFNLKAIAVLKQMQKIDPSQTDTYLQLAKLNEKQGLVGNAIAEYEALVEMHEKEGNSEESLKILEMMKDLDPDNIGVQIRVAQALVRAGLREKGLETFRETARSLEKSRDFSKLRRIYEMFISLFPEEVSIQAGFAHALIGDGEPEKGVQLLQGLLKKTPENHQILKWLARGYRQLGDHENERLTYRHLLKMLPDDSRLQMSCLRATLDSGAPEKALELLQEWHAALLKGDEKEELTVIYEELLEAFPDDSRVVEPLKEVYAKTGNGSKLLQLEGGEPEEASTGFPVNEENNEIEVSEELALELEAEIGEPEKLEERRDESERKESSGSAETVSEETEAEDLDVDSDSVEGTEKYELLEE
ncbi:MAG TPA: tetratricopeptide repeat protein, partial [Desulfuromonadales bacterium]|nr:tetratricopeptide repeat protein [Desulfuromonadales bacterium]